MARTPVVVRGDRHENKCEHKTRVAEARYGSGGLSHSVISKCAWCGVVDGNLTIGGDVDDATIGRMVRAAINGTEIKEAVHG